MCNQCNRPLRRLYARLGGRFANLPDRRRPVERYDPLSMSALRHGPNAVNLKIVQALLTALANAASKGSLNAALDSLGGRTIAQFKGMNDASQMQVVNDVWDLITQAQLVNTLAQNMTETAGAALPTSWRPANPGNINSCHAGIQGNVWRQWAIGFRVDGSTTGNALDRIRQNGLVPQNRDLCRLRNRGSEFWGTVIADPATVRYWVANDDIVNETAVCVSRNFFGATAFPERGTDSRDPYYLWAANCHGLAGFDCEHTQAGANRVWRPGEKAFHQIPAERILGWVRVYRDGAPPQGGWRFHIDRHAYWNWVQPPQNDAVYEYLTSELDAWKGYNYTVPADWDFQ